MLEDIKIGILFNKYYINENLIILLPERLLLGQTDEKLETFYDNLSLKKYFNSDYSIGENYKEVFNIITDFDCLKNKYKKEDFLEDYFNEVSSKIYYYDIQNEDIEECYQLKSLSKRQFEKKYNIKLSNLNKNDEEDKKSLSTKIKKLNLTNSIMFQERPLEELIYKIYTNLSVKNSEFVSNMIVYGKEGVGKTQTFKQLSKGLNIPISIVDYNNLTEEEDCEFINSVLNQLYNASNDNPDLAEKGIVVIDGIDDDKSRSYRVQDLLDDLNPILKKRKVRVNLDTGEGFTFDTSHLTVILCGRFQTLKNTEKRIQIPSDFFLTDSKKNNFYDEYSITDFIYTYPESWQLFDYFDTVIGFNDLTKENIKQILLNSDISPLNEYKKMLIEEKLSFDSLPTNVVNTICEKAYRSSTNCKFLKKELDRIFKKSLLRAIKEDVKNSKLIINDNIMKNSDEGFQIVKNK